MSFKDLPQQMVENTIDQMSVKDMLAFRLTNNENKAIADRLIVKRHKAQFGPTDKNIGNMIKDLVLETVFSKLKKSKFSDPTLGQDMLSYGIGDVVGQLTHNGNRVNFGVFKARSIQTVFPFWFLVIKRHISVMERLAVEYPRLAVAIRIATHHYINTLTGLQFPVWPVTQNAGVMTALEILNNVHPNSTLQYNADILVPNQADIIRKTIFKDFYTTPRPGHGVESGQINGLRNNPLKSMLLRIQEEGHPYFQPILASLFTTKTRISNLIDYDVRLNESDKETLNEYVTYLFSFKKTPADDRVFSAVVDTL